MMAMLAILAVLQRQEDSQTTQTGGGAVRDKLIEGYEKNLRKGAADVDAVLVVVVGNGGGDDGCGELYILQRTPQTNTG